MNQFATYYHQQFRQDLIKFFSEIPDESRFHEDQQKKNIFSIQIERLTGNYPHLDFLNNEERAFFGVALYFTILVDMVCYTYYKKDYLFFSKPNSVSKIHWELSRWMSISFSSIPCI